MGFILFIIASILKLVIGIIAYIFGAINSLFNRQWNSWHFDLAQAKDQYGNALCKYFFNVLLITKEGYPFGNIDETISSVLGKNKAKNTLTLTGKFIAWVLDKLEKNHVENAIDNTIL